MKAAFLIPRSAAVLCVLYAFAVDQLPAVGAQTVLPAGSIWRYLDTGIDLDALIDVARRAERIVGHKLPSAALRSGSLSKLRMSQP